MTELQKLRQENATLRDLLESAYRQIDKERVEAEKADDEAIEHKTAAAQLRLLGTRREVALVFEWKRRAENAEAKLAKARQ